MALDAPLPALGGAIALAPERHGLKAHGLDRALRLGERVPQGFAVDCITAAQIAAGDSRAHAQLDAALARLVADESGVRLAVRASAVHSLPGALLTRLHVAPERESVIQAVRDVLASAHAKATEEHWASQRAAPPGEPWVGVLLQRQMQFQGEGDFGAVLFTRDPNTGEASVRGEYARAGAAEVASGRSSPAPLEARRSMPLAHALAEERPEAWNTLCSLAERLERAFDAPLEIELAYCGGVAWVLQARPLTFTARALVRLALEAIDADSPHYARWLGELSQRGLPKLIERHFAAHDVERASALCRGVAASPGVASGALVTDVSRAVERAQREPVVLVRADAVPEDIAGFRVAQAVVTSSGGLTCHAAVIARGLGLPAVVGVGGVRVDAARGVLWGGRDGRELLAREGDPISVDARRGIVYAGQLGIEQQIRDGELARLFAELRKLRPGPLWVAGPAAEALRLKEEASLDGALCTWAGAAHDLPEGRGRECWLEIDAEDVEAWLAHLPRGWGVVVTGRLRGVSLAALRRAAPLRAWGVRFESADTELPDAALDLAVFSCAPDAGLQNSVQSARRVHLMKSGDVPPVPDGNNVGWACPVSTAALTALRYASVRRPSEAGLVR